ncbi:MAG: hypothetical protein ACRC3J_05265 [Culicoidibacterales bacterium]
MPSPINDVWTFQYNHANMTPGHHFSLNQIQSAFGIMSSFHRPTHLPQFSWFNDNGTTRQYTRHDSTRLSIQDLNNIGTDGIIYPMYWSNDKGKSKDNYWIFPDSYDNARFYMNNWDASSPGFIGHFESHHNFMYARYIFHYLGQAYTVDVTMFYRGGSSKKSKRKKRGVGIRAWAPNNEVFVGLTSYAEHDNVAWHEYDLGRENILGVPSDGSWYSTSINPDGPYGNYWMLRILNRPMPRHGADPWLYQGRVF